MQLHNIGIETDARGVMTITLDRAEKHNAFNSEMIAELTYAFQQANLNPTVRAVVLASTGKSFCAGADIHWMREMASFSYEQNQQDAQQLATMFKALYDINVLTIARVQGAAFGGAIGLIACCDIAVANKMSKFCLSEVKIGLVPATISPYVIAAMGARVAKRYFMTAEAFSSRRARRLGLISEAVSEDSLDSTIDDILVHVLKNGPQAVRLSKQLVEHIHDKPIDDALLKHTSDIIAQVRVSAEGQEGLGAFLDKRSPDWTGVSS
ncbi:enoyl-CoA hydratase/isomerase family protein [Alteromonas oceanisediminis]|uniref:enoyl-CoA hydratase/isomerase family protein n=1 Tax=Alteromonas oceanisediminis TaxID=2836180 RepID=UPI001BD9A966|nr:enoyl-CoA hydratase/isomerase family protein [Alteromonas oceanisediminis]MBT0587241.1 enoyl-CoA hydratase/isomerase family protein [Alteromonas oceanisediminis]